MEPTTKAILAIIGVIVLFAAVIIDQVIIHRRRKYGKDKDRTNKR